MDTTTAGHAAWAHLPKRVTLKDGSPVTLRVLVPEDADRLVALFADISYSDLRELRDNVLDERVVRRWCRYINYDRVLPVVAEVDGRLVADATLHRKATPAAADVGRFRAYVHPTYRHRGLATMLLEEIKVIARNLRLKTLAVECFNDQEGLIRHLEALGFVRQAFIPAYQTVVLVYTL
ncbi:MAG: GNAT family N-acetyltransferase [Armatimonadota bacterium]|nr:GNAT family N-acetyltransferase [Armatimonadota bacterium]